MPQNVAREVLVLIVCNIKGNLVSNEIMIVICNQSLQQNSTCFRDIQEELAFADLEVVKVATISLSGLIDSQEESHHFISEIFALDDILGEFKALSQLLFQLSALFYRLSELIKSSALKS